MCNHDNIEIQTTPVRNATITKFRIDISAKCADCSERFRFVKAYGSATDGCELTAEIKAKPFPENRPLSAQTLKEMNKWQLK